MALAAATVTWALAGDLHRSGETAPPLTVFAASSLTEVLPRVANAWQEMGGTPAVFSFDASSRLALQIEAGAPGDLFWSADERWLDDPPLRARLEAATRAAFLGNRLVAVVPAGVAARPANAADLALPRFAHLVLAGTEVPAGAYAEMALARLGIWEVVRARVVRADNVRAALAWVARGDAEAGIVFATDARTDPRVQVAFVLPDSSQPRIAYAAAVVRGAPGAAAARRFLEFCRGPEARRLFTAAGFQMLPAPESPNAEPPPGEPPP